MILNLDSPLTQLYGVGQALIGKFKNLGIVEVKDLLFYYPSRHEDFSNILKIDQLALNQSVTVKGKIEIIKNRRSWRRKIYLTEAIVTDSTGSVNVVWFNQPFLTKVLAPGDEILLSGKFETDKYGSHLTSPIYERAKREQVHTGRIVPVYRTTAGLTQKQLRAAIKLTLSTTRFIPDFLPTEMKKAHQLVNLPLALNQIHFPSDHRNLNLARDRLKFDELFVIQLYALQNKKYLKTIPAPALDFKKELIREFVKSLPFKLTDGQRKAAWEILRDLGQSHPMNRLLEGEVGSGKTVVAAMAILNAVLNGYQAVFLAPTEILSSQHFDEISKLVKKFKIRVGLLTRSNQLVSGSNEPLTRKKLQNLIADGSIQVIIGTHALIQERVSFKNLGLAIVDEQHRFGVSQRKLLREKSISANDKRPTFVPPAGKTSTLRPATSDPRPATRDLPHLLSMTATPIPRTLALTVYGDLDLSIIDELPKERKKIVTKIVPPAERKEAYDFISDQVKAGRQVFVICPLIEESDRLGVKAATSEFEKLSEKIFPGLKIGLLHGRLKSALKEKTRREFLNGKIDILVSTAVVEVGIDVPNASVMMIEGAERFGLAQLHQFRGRVGRSHFQSYCFLLTESDSEKTRERLQAVVACDNGFALAEKDLEMRGPGDVYGFRQTGLPDLKIATLTDHLLIKKAKEEAAKLINLDPTLKNYPLLQEKIKDFQAGIHWE